MIQQLSDRKFNKYNSCAKVYYSATFAQNLLTEDMQTENKSDIIDTLIAARRSIYPHQFIPGKKVDDALIQKMLGNANFAPTHKHTEPWRFTVFTGEGLKKLAEWQSGLYLQKEGENAKENKLKKLREKPLMASHVIAVSVKRTLDKFIPEVEEIVAVGCAIQNILLTAAAYNLGAYISTGGMTYYPQAKTLLGLGEYDKLIGFIYVGYPKDDIHTVARREPVEEKTIWVRDGNLSS